ncbi:hypothetical protein PsYK624_137680 [Phanerochaete sordida]|uniref:Heterokaryon incompatibility domain-containing protein n=1 Tax=Phanerochaete sordida TaxID=48140 RepID=A0A9P3GLI8_9APHY|nr:hypothetical protein PsYK624_137680 [Phanerochaete sordida]
MSSSDLLSLYNNVLGSKFQLTDPGLHECLEHFIASSMDFGQLYGYLRHMQRPDFEFAIDDIEERHRRDEALRRDIVHGTYISNADVPPRRVWDLFSNRVLPFYVIPQSRTEPQGSPIPESLWTVSHSWVGTRARRAVWTSINGKQWPVPVPKGTTLDHVRVELLNLGAEYVWLDVLCLRQHGNEQDEALWVEEWKLDVPTIGYIYSIPRKPCITYFNGLGLPFDSRPETRASDCHWLHRVWTVQEATTSWLPGGATSKMSRDAAYFFREVLPNAIPASSIYPISIAVTAVQQRSCTTPLDRVHGLAYVLNCSTLPIYDEDIMSGQERFKDVTVVYISEDEVQNKVLE